jgi:hypothetical protein
VRAQLEPGRQVKDVLFLGARWRGYDKLVCGDLHESARLQFLHALTKKVFNVAQRTVTEPLKPTVGGYNEEL